MANLTPKQEKFVQGLVSGMSQRRAYKEAFNSAEMKDHTIDNKASELFAQQEIRARYNELVEEANKRVVWSREKSINERLWLLEEIKQSIIDDGVQRYNVNGFNNTLQAIDKLTFNNPYLQDELLELEVEKLKEEIRPNSSQDDKIMRFISLLDKSIRQEDSTDEKTTDEDI